MAESSRAAAEEPLPPTFARLSSLLDEKPEALALGDEDIRETALAAAKFIFDQALKTEAGAQRHIGPFLASLQPTEAPKTRSQARAEARAEAQAKGKAKEKEQSKIEWSTTPLDTLHVAGAEDAQIWAQLDLRANVLCEVLSQILEETLEDPEERAALEEKAKAEVAGDEMDLDLDDGFDDDLGEGDSDEDSEGGMSELDALLTTEEEDDSSDGEEAEHELDLRDPSDDEDDDEDDEDGEPAPSTKKPSGPKSALDDGFFSLAEFNRETDLAEARSRSSGRLKDDSDESSEEDEDVDLFTSVDPEPGDDDVFDEDDLETSGELYYKDFFDPPSRKALAAAAQKKPPAAASKKKKRQGYTFDDDDGPSSPKKSTPSKRKVTFHDKVRVKNIKPSPLRRRVLFLNNYLKSQGLKAGSDSDSDEEDEDEDGDAVDEDGDGMDVDWDAMDSDDLDGEGSTTEEDEEEERGRAAMERLKDDLFAEEEDESGPSGLSAHEKRMADLSEQIRQLETENVGPKEWTLMGEANVRSRPANALLEQDLDFERASRPVPQVTEEKVSTIEALIKQRILENNFDDVERKRPDVGMAPRRADFEISDQKSQKSLAQLYEDDFSAAKSGTATVDDRDGKLGKEHAALEQMWENISYKLDALCNAHFTPKAPQTKIQTISNVAAASLESALPTSHAAATMLAPEEISARATGKDLVAKSEMTPKEKQAARQRAKKARSKQRDAVVAAKGKVAGKGKGSVKKEKERALSAVTKGRGVTVVGKANGRDAKGTGGKGHASKPVVDGKKLKL